MFTFSQVILSGDNYCLLERTLGIWIKPANNIDSSLPTELCRGEFNRIKPAFNGQAVLAEMKDGAIMVIPLGNSNERTILKSKESSPKVLENDSNVLDFVSLGNKILIIYDDGSISLHIFSLENMKLIASNNIQLIEDDPVKFGRASLALSPDTSSPVVTAFLVESAGFMGGGDQFALVFEVDEASKNLKKLFYERRKDNDYQVMRGREIVVVGHRREDIVVVDVDRRESNNTGSTWVDTKVHHLDLKGKQWKTVKTHFFNFFMDGLAQVGQGFGSDVILSGEMGEVKVMKHEFVG